MTNGEEEAGESAEPVVSTVAHRILNQFFDDLQAIEGFQEIAGRLHEAVLDNGSYAEAAIRRAMFGDEGA
jgi:hypothetical protein